MTMPIVLALAGCATVPAQTLQQNWAKNGYTIDNTGWGQTTSYFAILPDGSADVWEFRQPEGAGFHDFEVAKYHATVPAAARSRFETEISRMMAGKPAKPKCGELVRDASSSEIHWGERQTFGVYHGCIDAKSKAYAEKLTSLIGEFRGALIKDNTPYRDWAPSENES